MRGAPGTVGLQIFLLTAIGVVDPAVQHQFRRAALDLPQGNLAQQRHRIVVELLPARRIELAEQAGGIVIPTPPQISGQLPELLLGGLDESIESAGFADHGRHLRGRLRQHPNLVFLKNPGFGCLNHQHTLQNTSIDERDPQEGLVGIFAGLAKVLEARMVLHLLHGDRTHLFRYQSGQTFVQRQPQSSDTFAAKPQRRGQHQVARSGSSRYAEQTSV